MALILICVLIGLVAGSLTATVGTGAGLIIIPALVVLAHLNTKTSIGTSLTAMLLPVGAFAAYVYWRNGDVNIRDSVFIAIGFMVGSFLMARYANGLSSVTLSRGFGAVTILIGIKMLVF
ncbi:MAG: TSUP family transporter [Candidatus Saccharimonadales bacterium]